MSGILSPEEKAFLEKGEQSKTNTMKHRRHTETLIKKIKE
jgi:hypothetical protein